MTIQVTYPFDPSGVTDECYIKDESHVVVSNDATYRVIVPELAPFYTLDLSIVHDASGKTLVENDDFNLAYKIIDAAVVANRTLYGGIILTNSALKGTFTLQYRTVGGNYVGIKSDVATYLANALNNPIQTSWDKVEDRPYYFAPAKHEQHYADFINKEDIATSIDAIADAVTTKSVDLANSAIPALEAKVTALSNYIDNYDYDAHIVNTNNPHNVTPEQAYALPTGDAAVDAFMAYNKTLVELADYINARGITQNDIDKYLHKAGAQTMLGDLVLSDNNAVITNTSGTASIDLSNGDIVLSSDSVTELAGDADRATSSVSNVILKSGKNILEITTSGNGDMTFDTLTYNGYEVLNGNNAKALLSASGSIGMSVVTEDTDTISWTGNSREGDPLTATLSVPIATTSEVGITQLTNSPDVGGTSYSPTPSVLNTIRNKLAGKADKAVTINGRSIVNNVDLVASNIYLGQVDNTEDVDKPVSTAQQDEIDDYSDEVHTHTAVDVALTKATTKVKGVMRLGSSISDSNLEGAVATPALIEEIKELVGTISTDEGGLMPQDVLDIRYWAPNDDVLCSGATITFPSSIELYMEQVDYRDVPEVEYVEQTVDLAASFPGEYVNQTFYLFIEVVDNALHYFASKSKLSNTGLRLHIATVRMGTGEILDMREEDGGTNTFDDNIDGILNVEAVTSVGSFRELEEHLNDAQAHFGKAATVSTNDIGLDLVRNIGTSKYGTDAIHYAIPDWDLYAPFANGATKFEMLPITVANGTVDISQGVELTLPNISNIDSLFIARNLNANFTDPAYAVEEYDGTLTRRVKYTLNAELEEGINIVDTYAILIGSYLDEDGNRHDLIGQSDSLRVSGDMSYNITHYINGVAGSNVMTFNCTGLTMDDDYYKATLEVSNEFLDDGFKYIIVLTYTGPTSTLISTTTLEVLSNEVNGEQFFTRIADDDDEIFDYLNNVEYENSSVETLFKSGVIGLAGIVGPADTAETFKMTVDLNISEESGLENRYVSAAGVYQALKDGCNVFVARGQVAYGEDLPILPNYTSFTRYNGFMSAGVDDVSNIAIETFGMTTNGAYYTMSDNSDRQYPTVEYMIIGYRDF